MRSVSPQPRRRELLRRVVKAAAVIQPAPKPSCYVSVPGKSAPLAVTGMFGIGDNIHQRAVLRELMKKHDVFLSSYYGAMFHDLVADGLKLMAMARTIGRIRDGDVPVWGKSAAAPPGAARLRISYTPHTILGYGSILAAQYASVGLKMPLQPDFSLPVPTLWRQRARDMLAKWRSTKPLMVYRPIILNKVWHCPSRTPDPEAYERLYQAIRDQFFVVSVADLKPQREWIVGGEQDVDVKFHRGELDFETLAGLVAEAQMVFGNPGFTPVLAQAVGTPNVVVYGGNETFQTTNRVGAHLAPTLAIEPDRPCPCHNREHKCDKRITIEPAVKKLMSFVDGLGNLHASRGRVTLTVEREVMPDSTDPGNSSDKMQPQSVGVKPAAAKILIFGTTYVDTSDRLRLTEQWVRLHSALNPDCDLLLVDSQSPLLSPILPWLQGPRLTYSTFPDNIGHLSRNGPDGPKSKGQDGWGRAFCDGLQYAIDNGYDYVVHIEGDSLFKRSVAPIIKSMQEDGDTVLSVPVEGTRKKEFGWVETGLMFFKVKYLEETDFIKRYNWPDRSKKYPMTPERVIFSMLGKDLAMANWRAERGDKSHITVENVHELDWVTHCHGQPEIYDKFITQVGFDYMDEVAKEVMTTSEFGADYYASKKDTITLTPSTEDQETYLRSLIPMVKLNFGCGTNRLDGWQNYDAEVNITKKLPFKDSSADYIFAEHCVEHISHQEALSFFKECRRVLKPGGVVRITVPSIERVRLYGDQEYFDFVFVRKWAPTADVRGAMDALINKHGHKDVWTQSRLEASLFYAGFDEVHSYEPGHSVHMELKGVEGHGRVIGDKFNRIESVCTEGR